MVHPTETVLSSLRWRRGATLAALGLAQLSFAPEAFATPESDAKDLFARGRELRANNDCGSAAPLFRKAWQIYPKAVGPLRNLAECEEQLGHFASSRRAWLDLKRALITLPPDAKYDGWDADADTAAARLKPKVASFVVDVYVKSNEGETLANDKSGIELFVNGESIGTALAGTPLERDPGPYLIRAQTTDAKPVETSVNLSAGDNPHITLRLTREPKPAVALTSPPPEMTHTGRRTAGFVVAGVGAAALIGSGVTFLLRQSAKSDLEDACPNYENAPCPEARRSELEDTVDKGQTMSTLTSILLPVGAVGVALGVVLVVTSKPTQKTALQLGPGGLKLGGTF